MAFERLKNIYASAINWYKSDEKHRAALKLWLSLLLYLHILFIPEYFALPHYVNYRNPFHLYRQNLSFLLLLSGLPLMLGRVWGRILMVLYGIIGIYNVVQLYALCRFQMKLDGLFFQILEVTNLDEISEFSQSSIFWYDFIPLVAVILMTTAIGWKLRVPSRTDKRLGAILCIPFLLAALVPLCSGKYWWLGKRNGFCRCISSYFASYTGYRKTLQEIIASPKLPSDIHRIAPENADVYPHGIVGIVVVGESARRGNMECYGYSRPTTPCLMARKKQLLFFDNVISAATSTFRCCVYDFTLAKIGNFSKPELSICDLLLAGGFMPHLYSVQHASGKHESMGLLFRNATDKQFIRETKGGASQDMSLLKCMNQLKSLANDESHIFFLHTMGSHRTADKRYPPEYEYFKDSFRDENNSGFEPESAAYVNKYDNSIRYTDAFLEEIIKMAEELNRPAFVLFFSDHAECLNSSDSNVNFRAPDNPEVYEIPFILYLNPEYVRCWPTYSENMKANTHLPLQADNTFFAICSLARIGYNGFPEEDNIFSPLYKPPHRYMKESTKFPYPEK